METLLIVEQLFTGKLLRYFLHMKHNEFCAIYFAQFEQNRKYFLQKLCMKQNFSFVQFFFAQFAQNRKFYAKCNFLGTLSKIDILSLE